MNKTPSSFQHIRTILIHPTTVMVLRIFLGGIMVYAGILKLIDMPGMAKSIAHYRILPEPYIHLAAIFLPALEAVAGCALIAGIGKEGALFLITGMFVMFVVAVESAIWRGLDIYCGCFGTTDAERVGINVLLRDGFLLLATLPLWMSYYRIGERNVSPEAEKIDSSTQV